MAEFKKTDSSLSHGNVSGDPATGSPDFFSRNRETIESIVVAIILALLFRAFIAEAFVIPTGSMAPTLMGRHVDVWCDECKFHYQASGSAERDGEDRPTDLIVADSRCPNCGYRKLLDKSLWSNENSFSGDRIIVSKFAYALSEPERWDVIVFKFPGRAQQNYIKRLIGLPNETIKIGGGNIYIKRPGESNFVIARKGDSKLLALLQTVHDSDFPTAELQTAGWPIRWQKGETAESQAAVQGNELGTAFTISANGADAWLRYHHFDPGQDDWNRIVDGEKLDLDPNWRGRLISDFYAYNCETVESKEFPQEMPRFDSAAFGQLWVDDLALECEAEAAEAKGEILLDMVRAGAHFTCRLNLVTGQASLAAHDPAGMPLPFGEGSEEVQMLTASMPSKGAGTYRLRMSNVDHEVRVWVNGTRLTFNAPATYQSEVLTYPDIERPDGDLAPLGVGGNDQAFTVKHLRVLRDKYYIASRFRNDEYGLSDSQEITSQQITQLLKKPTQSRLDQLLRSRRERVFELGADQFMPLGDNSPASSDARYWPDSNSRSADWQGPYVERHLLVGKALFIYWPHTWNNPPLLPNFRRMQPIH